MNLLKNKKTDALVPNESVALALVMHFVGDIHHCGDGCQLRRPIVHHRRRQLLIPDEW
jgi:hypothetical protein